MSNEPDSPRPVACVTAAGERLKVVQGLVPTGVVFLRCYNRDALWSPKSIGYTNNIWAAGFYDPKHVDYLPCGENRGGHSFTHDVQELLHSADLQDDTILAVLVDEIIRLRVALTDSAGAAGC